MSSCVVRFHPWTQYMRRKMQIKIVVKCQPGWRLDEVSQPPESISGGWPLTHWHTWRGSGEGITGVSLSIGHLQNLLSHHPFYLKRDLEGMEASHAPPASSRPSEASWRPKKSNLILGPKTTGNDLFRTCWCLLGAFSPVSQTVRHPILDKRTVF